LGACKPNTMMPLACGRNNAAIGGTKTAPEKGKNSRSLGKEHAEAGELGVGCPAMIQSIWHGGQPNIWNKKQKLRGGASKGEVGKKYPRPFADPRGSRRGRHRFATETCSGERGPGAGGFWAETLTECVSSGAFCA